MTLIEHSRRERLYRLLVNLPEARKEVEKLPGILDYWLDLAYGVTPCLMVRYGASDPKTERVRLWTKDELEQIWREVEDVEFTTTAAKTPEVNGGE
jgi:hypothetical protein